VLVRVQLPPPSCIDPVIPGKEDHMRPPRKGPEPVAKGKAVYEIEIQGANG